MAFFEGLKKIIPAKIAENSYDYDLILSESSTAKVNFKVDKENKKITLFLNKLSFKEKEILRKHLLANFESNKLRFIESEKINLIEKLISYNKRDDGHLIEFFKDILSKNDLLALRDSLFLRDEYLNSNSISQLKRDIAFSYGERGNIISNLCTSGYFEEIMIPLYNKNKTEFFEFYDMAVDRGVKAFFVNAGMSITFITQEIETRLASAHSYGLKSINIHGIGSKNVKNIKKSLVKVKNNNKVSFLKKNIYEKDNVVIVELILS